MGVRAALQLIFDRFAGRKAPCAASATQGSRVRVPLDPAPKSLGRSTCVIVGEPGARNETLLATMRSAGMQVQEVSRIDAETVLTSKPDLIVTSNKGDEEILEIIRSLQEISFDGPVQPVGNSVADMTMSSGGKVQVLPALQTPVDVAALRQVIDQQGLGRSSSGHVSVLLSSVLENKWLIFGYQPKICLRTMTLIGAEIFARAEHPVHGVLLPSAFLPHSNSVDLRRLGLASLKTAMKSWEPFHRLGFNLSLSVNIPLEALEIEEITALARSVRPRDGRWPGLTIEIETADCLSATEEIRDFQQRARGAGIRVALDNFGVGASMTTDLSGMGIAEIKLHPGLVQESPVNPARQLTCRAAVDLARTYRASVTCNAVESLDEVKFLRGLGCEAAQGRVFSPVLRRVDFAALLRSKAAARAA